MHHDNNTIVVNDESGRASMKGRSYAWNIRSLSTMSLREQKTSLRKRVEESLKKLEPEEIERQCRTPHKMK